MAQTSAPFAQLPELVLPVLSFIVFIGKFRVEGGVPVHRAPLGGCDPPVLPQAALTLTGVSLKQAPSARAAQIHRDERRHHLPGTAGRPAMRRTRRQ